MHILYDSTLAFGEVPNRIRSSRPSVWRCNQASVGCVLGAALKRRKNGDPELGQE